MPILGSRHNSHPAPGRMAATNVGTEAGVTIQLREDGRFFAEVEPDVWLSATTLAKLRQSIREGLARRASKVRAIRFGNYAYGGCEPGVITHYSELQITDVRLSADPGRGPLLINEQGKVVLTPSYASHGIVVWSQQTADEHAAFVERKKALADEYAAWQRGVVERDGVTVQRFKQAQQAQEQAEAADPQEATGGT